MSTDVPAGIIRELSGGACELAAQLDGVCEWFRDLSTRIERLVHDPSGERLRAFLDATGLPRWGTCWRGPEVGS